jgi:hypothetical protein
MQITRTPRARRALAAALAVFLVAGLGACHITWHLGSTHGAIIETSAARASIGIWRAPTRLLADIERAQGVNRVQQILCAAGNFPAIPLGVGGRSISAATVKKKWCGYVNGDDGDLRGALRDAQEGKKDDCLALTLISSGAYIKNWTHKSAGCKTGSLG